MSIATPTLPASGDLKPLAVSVRAGRALIGVGNSKFYELIADGKIKTVKCGSKTLVIYQSLEKLIAQLEAAS
jgi:excisionase family DNA binding protein